MITFEELFSMLVDVCALLNVILLIEVPFGAKVATNGKKLVITSILFLLMELLLESVLHLNPNTWGVTFEYIYMFFTVFLFATEKRLRTALLTVPAVLVYVQCGNIGYLINILVGIENDGSPVTYWIDVCLVFALLWMKQSKNRIAKMKLTLGEIIFLCIFCIFSPTLVVVLESLEALLQNNIYNLMWVVLVLAMNVAVVYGIYNRKRARHYKSLSESYKQHFDEEYSYFKQYKDNNRDMTRFRHDWNNHMIVMQDLLEQGKYEEAKKYFDTFPAVGKKKARKLLTGNETVDTIFAAKANLFDKYNIELKFEGKLTRLVDAEPVDICILFSNLVDNAIEACSKCNAKRYFHIKVTESPQVVMMVFQNSMVGDIVIEDNTIKTSKADMERHGFGLQNIEEIVRKYNGESVIEAEAGRFTIKIILPM